LVETHDVTIPRLEGLMDPLNGAHKYGLGFDFVPKLVPVIVAAWPSDIEPTDETEGAALAKLGKVKSTARRRNFLIIWIRII
jgi:hypothetical protein